MLEIKGYASLFGIKDLAGDVVEKGAFLQSLKEYPAQNVRMLYQHDPKKPIGEWTNIVEDEIGLLVEGVIFSSNADAELARVMLETKGMDGLSIGFRTRDYMPLEGGGRVLKQIDLREVSLVGFPMLPQAKITQFNLNEAA